MPSFMEGLASGLERGIARKRQSKQDEIRAKLQGRQLDLQGLNIQLKQEELRLKQLDFSAQQTEQEFQQKFFEAAGTGGFEGGVQFLENNGRLKQAATLRQAQATLNKSLSGTKKDEAQLSGMQLENLQTRQVLVGNIASAFFKQVPEDKRAERWKEIQPLMSKVWKDAPKAYNSTTELLLGIAIKQAMPQSAELKRLTTGQKLMNELQIAVENKDKATATQLTAELTKRRMIVNPVTGELVDLASGGDIRLAAELTHTTNLDSAQAAPKGVPIIPRGTSVSTTMKKALELTDAERKSGRFKVPGGFRKKDITNPSAGIEAIPGGKTDASTLNDAGKTQLLRVAQATIPELKSIYFKDDDSVNWLNIVNSINIGVPGVSSLQIQGFPKSRGRTAASLMDQGIQAITRIETGAAMREEELEHTRRRFLPSPLDSEELVRMKLLLYEAFLQGTVNLLNPSGSFDDRRFDDGLNYLRAGGRLKDLIHGKLKNKKELKGMQDLTASPQKTVEAIKAMQGIPDDKKKRAIDAIMKRNKDPKAVLELLEKSTQRGQ